MDAASIISKCVVDKVSDESAASTDDESTGAPHYVCRAEYDTEKVRSKKTLFDFMPSSYTICFRALFPAPLSLRTSNPASPPSDLKYAFLPKSHRNASTASVETATKPTRRRTIAAPTAAASTRRRRPQTRGSPIASSTSWRRRRTTAAASARNTRP